MDAGFLPAHRTAGGHRRLSVRHLEDFARRRNLPLAPSGAPAPRRILLVDDDRDFLDLLSERIRGVRADLAIQTAEDGFRAGLIVSLHRPDLVLLDIRMPGLDGIDVCAAIKADPATRGTRIVGLTALRDEDEIAALLQAGAEEVLPKPVDPDEIRDLLLRYLPLPYKEPRAV